MTASTLNLNLNLNSFIFVLETFLIYSWTFCENQEEVLRGYDVALHWLARTTDRSDLAEMLSTPSMLWIQLSPWAQLERARLRLWAPVQIRMLPPKYFRQVWKKPKFAEICFEHLSSHVFPCKAAQMRSYSWKEFDLVDWHLTGCAAERFPFLAKSLIRLVLTHCTGSCQITLVRKKPSSLSKNVSFQKISLYV